MDGLTLKQDHVCGSMTRLLGLRSSGFEKKWKPTGLKFIEGVPVVFPFVQVWDTPPTPLESEKYHGTTDSQCPKGRSSLLGSSWTIGRKKIDYRFQDMLRNLRTGNIRKQILLLADGLALQICCPSTTSSSEPGTVSPNNFTNNG